MGKIIRESAESNANRMIGEKLKELKWQESELGRRRKGEPGKVQIALRLREQTTMTLAWIAERLRMGTRTHLSHLLYWEGRSRRKHNGKT